MWKQFEVWVVKKAYPWLKKSWMEVVNFVMWVVAYGALDTDSTTGTLVGLWLFLLMGYYIFWKLFGAENMFPFETVQAPPVVEKPVEKVEVKTQLENPVVKKPRAKKIK